MSTTEQYNVEIPELTDTVNDIKELSANVKRKILSDILKQP